MQPLPLTDQVVVVATTFVVLFMVILVVISSLGGGEEEGGSEGRRRHDRIQRAHIFPGFRDNEILHPRGIQIFKNYAG